MKLTIHDVTIHLDDHGDELKATKQLVGNYEAIVSRLHREQAEVYQLLDLNPDVNTQYDLLHAIKRLRRSEIGRKRVRP